MLTALDVFITICRVTDKTHEIAMVILQFALSAPNVFHTFVQHCCRTSRKWCFCWVTQICFLENHEQYSYRLRLAFQLHITPDSLPITWTPGSLPIKEGCLGILYFAILASFAFWFLLLASIFSISHCDPSLSDNTLTECLGLGCPPRIGAAAHSQKRLNHNRKYYVGIVPIVVHQHKHQTLGKITCNNYNNIIEQYRSDWLYALPILLCGESHTIKVMWSIKVIGNRLWKFLTQNNIIDMKMQKGFWSSINGVTEHIEFLKYLIKHQKLNKRDT